MSGFASTLFIGAIAMPVGRSLHWERVHAIQTSDELGLRSQPDFPLHSTPQTQTLDAADDREPLELAFHMMPCFWSAAGRGAGVERNSRGSLHIGAVTLDGSLREVWASLVSGPADQYACDAPHRAHVVLQAVIDQRTLPAHRSVQVRGLGNANLDIWATTIPGPTVAARMAFVYDVLVAEAKGDTEDEGDDEM